MPCTVIRFPGGGHAIACGPKRKPKLCPFCKQQPAILSCDGDLGNGKTCDAPICDKCAALVGPDRDLCPLCRAAGLNASGN